MDNRTRSQQREGRDSEILGALRRRSRGGRDFSFWKACTALPRGTFHSSRTRAGKYETRKESGSEKRAEIKEDQKKRKKDESRGGQTEEYDQAHHGNARQD